jgi:hypothetical protein
MIGDVKATECIGQLKNFVRLDAANDKTGLPGIAHGIVGIRIEVCKTNIIKKMIY